jgi:archaellum component FlaC
MDSRIHLLLKIMIKTLYFILLKEFYHYYFKTLTLKINKIMECIPWLSSITRCFKCNDIYLKTEDYNKDMEKVNERLDHLQTDVNTLKTDVNILKTDMTDIKKEQEEMRKDLNELKMNTKAYLTAICTKLDIVPIVVEV